LTSHASDGVPEQTVVKSQHKLAPRPPWDLGAQTGIFGLLERELVPGAEDIAQSCYEHRLQCIRLPHRLELKVSLAQMGGPQSAIGNLNKLSSDGIVEFLLLDLCQSRLVALAGSCRNDANIGPILP